MNLVALKINEEKEAVYFGMRICGFMWNSHSYNSWLNEAPKANRYQILTTRLSFGVATSFYKRRI